MTKYGEAVTIKTLSEIPDEDLDRLVKAAKRLRADRVKDSIPQKVKDSLMVQHDRLMQGQSISLVVKPEIQFTFTAKGMKDWEELDCEAKLLNLDDKSARAFFDMYDIASTYHFDDPWCTFTRLDPRLDDIQQQESKLNDEWQKTYFSIRDTYGINVWDLVEEMKNEPEVLQQAQDDQERPIL
jgi:hypothetical protein